MKGDITINSRQAKYARAFIPNYVFYITFAYYGVVRMGTLSKFIGFSIYYILPTLYYFLYSLIPQHYYKLNFLST